MTNRFEFVSKEQYETAMREKIDPLGIAYADYENLKKPVRATAGSSGYDFFSPIFAVLTPGETITIPTGIKCKLKPMRTLLLLPRSSYGFKYRMQLDNTVGVIDQDYYNNESNEGHIFVKVTNDSKSGKILTIEPGKAFCQGLIMNFDVTEDDDVVTLRTGGIGSTSET